MACPRCGLSCSATGGDRYSVVCMSCSIRSDLAREQYRAEAPMRARLEVDRLTAEKLRLEIALLKSAPRPRKKNR